MLFLLIYFNPFEDSFNLILGKPALFFLKLTLDPSEIDLSF